MFRQTCGKKLQRHQAIIPLATQVTRRAIVHGVVAAELWEHVQPDGCLKYGEMTKAMQKAKYLYPWITRDQVNHQLQQIKKNDKDEVRVVSNHAAPTLLLLPFGNDETSKKGGRPKGTTSY
jgi:hypothetical protein